jgi:ZIP family zinc transporter
MDVLAIILIAFTGPIVGSLIGVLRRPSELFVNNALAFAAGVMLAISFMQLVPESIRLSSPWVCCAGVTLGALFMFALDKLVPHTDPGCVEVPHGRLTRRVAVYLLAGIALHHFPEGMAIALGAVNDFKISLAIVVAIAVHDIPEAICTSAPYYYVSGSRWRAFLLSASTAVPTVLGYLIAHALFHRISLHVVGGVVAATAGLMLYISGDELIPRSCAKHDDTPGHGPIFSLVAGAVFVIVLGSISK